MHIAGIGVVGNRGRGIASFEKALLEGWVAPRDSVYAVAQDTLKDKAVLKDLRRADDFSKMACLAAHDAFTDSALGPEQAGFLGLILATAFGPHVTTFRFLDDILTYGDGNVSPTVFSHSVHNAAASYVSSLLQSRGPTLTVTQFAHSFQQALILAESWLNEGRCRYVLAGSVDQCGKAMEYICSQKLAIAGDGKIKPFSCAQAPVAVPGEGSAFILLSNQVTAKKYAVISAQPKTARDKPDMYILDGDGMTGSEEAYAHEVKGGALVSSYTPIFGSMLTGSSFSCVAAALMLQGQQCYAAPVQDNPHGLTICKAHKPAALRSINCLRYGCREEKIEIFLIDQKPVA